MAEQLAVRLKQRADELHLDDDAETNAKPKPKARGTKRKDKNPPVESEEPAKKKTKTAGDKKSARVIDYKDQITVNGLKYIVHRVGKVFSLEAAPTRKGANFQYIHDLSIITRAGDLLEKEKSVVKSTTVSDSELEVAKGDVETLRRKTAEKEKAEKTDEKKKATKSDMPSWVSRFYATDDLAQKLHIVLVEIARLCTANKLAAHNARVSVVWLTEPKTLDVEKGTVNYSCVKPDDTFITGISVKEQLKKVEVKPFVVTKGVETNTLLDYHNKMPEAVLFHSKDFPYIVLPSKAADAVNTGSGPLRDKNRYLLAHHINLVKELAGADDSEGIAQLLIQLHQLEEVALWSFDDYKAPLPSVVTDLVKPTIKKDKKAPAAAVDKKSKFVGNDEPMKLLRASVNGMEAASAVEHLEIKGLDYVAYLKESPTACLFAIAMHEKYGSEMDKLIASKKAAVKAAKEKADKEAKEAKLKEEKETKLKAEKEAKAKADAKLKADKESKDKKAKEYSAVKPGMAEVVDLEEEEDDADAKELAAAQKEAALARLEAEMAKKKRLRNTPPAASAAPVAAPSKFASARNLAKEAYETPGNPKADQKANECKKGKAAEYALNPAAVDTTVPIDDNSDMKGLFDAESDLIPSSKPTSSILSSSSSSSSFSSKPVGVLASTASHSAPPPPPEVDEELDIN